MARSVWYSQYIHSNTWRDRRTSKIGNTRRCAVCGETEGLSVHHKNYERLGKERTDDLIVLCKSCHWIMDQERKQGNGIAQRYASFRGKSPDNLKLDAEEEQRRANLRGNTTRRRKNADSVFGD